MKSPFPGMDPFIEASGLWEDFHAHLIEKIADQLAESVPEHYLVRTGERSYVVLVEPEEGKDRHPFVAEPLPMSLRALIEEEYRETFIEIHEADSERRLVTSVEVLSPSNKRKHTPGWDVYLRKRQGLFLGKVNLVEIDLLRAGQRLPMRDPWPDSPYSLLVARPERSHRCLVWPAHFQRPLPPLPVPLAPPDQDIVLLLQPLVEGIYTRYRYRHSIDYSQTLQPPLTLEEAAWLEQQLR